MTCEQPCAQPIRCPLRCPYTATARCTVFARVRARQFSVYCSETTRQPHNYADMSGPNGRCVLTSVYGFRCAGSSKSRRRCAHSSPGRRVEGTPPAVWHAYGHSRALLPRSYSRTRDRLRVATKQQTKQRRKNGKRTLASLGLSFLLWVARRRRPNSRDLSKERERRANKKSQIFAAASKYKRLPKIAKSRMPGASFFGTAEGRGCATFVFSALPCACLTRKGFHHTRSRVPVGTT